ncbi:L-arabinose isomerase [Polaribacter reichenbachii]|uniref:L-arabinose isomerase n=1 Tax=Polaribacter reichenbachii TaxID=996801 RepID=A0A1B8U656_9FLAO|nr:L-arabinose isomerase [Polaribacter reichenbachii]APZ45942.1 L-arabinose isomerase [Polaribacter reichenbachii]AUC19804.1 L-arabinose isomerase [Polaribacter reichenbachii]OBY67341.1 L-arabinose isomerase [Polaribacter reichenbachii]
MIDISNKEIWFVTGSQHLYGEETLNQVAKNSQEIAKGLDDSKNIPVKIIFKPTVKTPSEITAICEAANASKACIGIITWMHTFSPAKMWIAGLNLLNKPLCHLHTQFNAEIPWKDINMDFMNLNQSAHGDREFGYIMSRMRIKRKVVVGHWQEEKVQNKIGIWSRVALGCDEMKNLKVARFGDNMREVAVTDGDKVEAQIRFGMSVNGYDSSDITKKIEDVTSEQVDDLVKVYEKEYNLSDNLKLGGKMRDSLIESAKIEIGLRTFLDEGGFRAFTDTFENLGSLKQLPGLAVQRLMADGYGFGGEGDWKTAAMLRVMKVMAYGLEGGTSFMEDYTYHFTPQKSYVLGSHMLEICPTIADAKPSCEVHPLGIGGKEDPVRLVFNSPEGDAINASLVDMGNRFRLIVNEVEAVKPMEDLPNLPVARVLWDAKPNLDIAATTWILAGGAHHTVYSQAITTEYMEDFADIFGIELLVIDNDTKVRSFKNTMNANEAYYNTFQHGL